MKKLLWAFLILLLVAGAARLWWPKADQPWSEYSDPGFGYSFSLPRSDVSALGWLKPAEADINDGVITSLGYEQGFFLQLYRPVSQAQNRDFAEYGQQVYERSKKNDRSRIYRDGQFITFGGQKAFTFTTQVKFDDLEYWRPEMIADPKEAKSSQPLKTAKVVYLNHRGRFFRIIYDPTDRQAVKTVNSFRFF